MEQRTGWNIAAKLSLGRPRAGLMEVPSLDAPRKSGLLQVGPEM